MAESSIINGALPSISRTEPAPHVANPSAHVSVEDRHFKQRLSAFRHWKAANSDRAVMSQRKQRRLNNSRLSDSPFSHTVLQPEDFVPGPTHHTLPPDFFAPLQWIDNSMSSSWSIRGDNNPSPSALRLREGRVQQEVKDSSPKRRDLRPWVSKIQKALRHTNNGTRGLVEQLDHRIRFFAIEAVLLQLSHQESEPDQSPDIESVPHLEDDNASTGAASNVSGDDWDDNNTIIISPDDLDSTFLPAEPRPAARRWSLFSASNPSTRNSTANGERPVDIDSIATTVEEEPLVFVPSTVEIPEAAIGFHEDDFGAETDIDQVDLPFVTGLELGTDGSPQMCVYAAEEQDCWARFIRFLAHTIGEYYGLETWSLTVHQPGAPSSNGTTVQTGRQPVVMHRWRRAYVGVDPSSEILETIPRQSAESGSDGEVSLLDTILAALPPPLSEIL